ncbi:LPXTG cell wall anchor domain-containing protein, partial [Apilactobacillus micheneri]
NNNRLPQTGDTDNRLYGFIIIILSVFAFTFNFIIRKNKK